MTQVNLEYVLSAPGSMGIFSNPVFSDHQDILKAHLLNAMQILNKHIQGMCIHTKPLISVLFNGYTESGYAQKLLTLDTIGATSVYADSGGLQIVTAGKPITPEIKQKIYETQSVADFAMCFDEIPLERHEGKQTINERSNVKNKIFDQSRHVSSGVLTGKNIKEQVEAFRALKTKTKVIMIIQGNCAEDMVDYYNAITSVLEPEDYEYIGGMAIADTCIGNGELESVEMLRGAKEISKVCHPNVAKHLHILGVGSVSRMRPILYLIKSGYLNTFQRISYDSSSHTSTFRFGLLKVNGTCRPLGLTRTKKAEAHFRNVYDFFDDMLSPILTRDEFLDMILLDGTTEWNYANVKKNAKSKGDVDKMVIAFLGNALHTYYQVANFVGCLDKVFEEDGEIDGVGKEISRLIGVKTDEDMSDWHKHLRKFVRSKRITRKENHGSLEGMFNATSVEN